jgi:RNA polymerase sigma factor (sigma-70 family)
MCAVVNLRRMRFLINRLPAARFRVDKAMANATRATSVITGMPHGSGSGDRMAENVILLDLAKQARDQITAELEAMRQQLGPLIEALDAPLQKSVMRLRYMDGMSVREIAYALNYSEQHIFRILQQAERKCESHESL